MKPSRKPESDQLKGWKEIAAFLGQPISAVHRWAGSGMPVHKDQRRVYSSRAELNQWLQGESAGEPVQISTDTDDLSADLKRGLTHVRKAHGNRIKKAKAR